MNAKKTSEAVSTFPKTIEKPATLPTKQQFYIFILAGQSNMAGRGIIMPEDTISNKHVLMLDKNNEWVYAKEPLHYYEAQRTGLDCGLSFAKELSKKFGDQITIGLVPCAVGGSSIEQWLGDSTYRNVKLYSNLLEKLKAAAPYGTIKGMLWHQGETNATASAYNHYKEKLESFFSKLRKDLNQSDMPIYIAQLSSFLTRYQFPMADEVNNDIASIATESKNVHLVNTTDLPVMKDSIHFNTNSQREMGRRFAKAVYNTH
jgi:hypothetical protein